MTLNGRTPLDFLVILVAI